MRGVRAALFLALLGVAAGLGESQDPNVALAPPSVAHRKLFQGRGQPPVPDDVVIPPANCTRPTQFSFMVSLRNDAGEHTCGGALINEGGNSPESRWVVTTAHCVDELAKPGALLLPDVDISGRRRDQAIERIPTEQTFLHPKWKSDRTRGNDIALLKLSNTSCYKFPLNIAEKNFTVPGNESVSFVAFGREGADAGFADQQQAGMFNIIPRKTCKQDYVQEGTKLKKSMICSRGNVNVAVCAGDEGSPIFWSPPKTTPEGRDPFAKRLVGIASFTDVDDCQSPDGTAFFTSISSFNKWIKKTIKKNS
ncbi:unnamed protein product [Ostreobium quekettii]|uniref:Peptidase S1 domain-containing protein n=1 Tax=Ostreobium quekettii TaxID=121088 RepID=A0A8S1IZW7_9CHLO|nr:unnamed protein product [Ostreobium quekettii]|eukprot:evm.model.scf_87.5 EVM.evm.TU.scf_87.5   scf_87:95343-100588(+)